MKPPKNLARALMALLVAALSLGGTAALSAEPATVEAKVVKAIPEGEPPGAAFMGAVILYWDQPLPAGDAPRDLLVQHSTGAPVPGAAQIQADRRVLVFIPDHPLTPKEEYDVRVSIHTPGVSFDHRGSFTYYYDWPTPSLEVHQAFPGFDHVNVGVGAVPWFAFNRPIDPKTLNKESVRMEGPNGLIPVTATFDAWNNVLSVTPKSLLEFDSKYKVTLSKGIKALTGGALDYPFVLNFSTRSPEPDVDTLSPKPFVAVSKPEPYGQLPNSAHPIQLSFSRAMDPQSFNRTTVQVINAGNEMPCDLHYTPYTRTLTITPAPNLKWIAGTGVRVTLNAQAMLSLDRVGMQGRSVFEYGVEEDHRPPPLRIPAPAMQGRFPRPNFGPEGGGLFDVPVKRPRGLLPF
jgi:hypothetical protein